MIEGGTNNHDERIHFFKHDVLLEENMHVSWQLMFVDTLAIDVFRYSGN
jgi:hypothetical protein